MATNPSINTFIRQAERQLVLSMGEIIQAGIAQAVAETVNPDLKLFGEGLKTAIAGKGGYRSLATANKDIALGAQEAVLKSYDQVVTARKSVPSYRVGQNRDSGGALRLALASGDMFVGTYNGFAFGNVATLDAEAKHWYRLNYGAGTKAGQGRPAGTFGIRLFGQTVVQVTDDSPASAAFKMPRGVFEEGGKFFPLSSKLTVPTEGIAARRYFDAGLAYVARNIEHVYGDLLVSWIDDAVRRGRGPVKNFIR